MLLTDLIPEKDERCFIAGKSGSGKSTMTRQMVERLPDAAIILVLDSKDEWKIKPFMKIGNHHVFRVLVPNVLLFRRAGIYVYKSSYPDFYDPNVTRLLVSAYKKKNVTVIVHEIYDFCHGSQPLPALGRLITKGRAKNIRMIMESQRPANIPLICLTEANRVLCFRLRNNEDRLRMARWVAPEMQQLPPGKHDFWYADDAHDAVLIKNSRTAEKPVAIELTNTPQQDVSA